MQPSHAMRNTSVQAVERAGAILLRLAEQPDASLRDLAACIGCSRTTAHRLLKALTRSGLVEARSDGRYAFGPAVVRMYGRWREQTDIRRVAHPFMVELRERAGETVSLDVRHGDAHVCIESLDSPNEIRRSVALGHTVPLLRGASGKVFLAALPEAELDALAERYDPAQRATLAAVRAELPAIREQGYATSAEERIAGGASIAAPIYNSAGEMFATITLSGPVQRVTPAFVAAIAPTLCATAARISERLGYAPALGRPAAAS